MPTRIRSTVWRLQSSYTPQPIYGNNAVRLEPLARLSMLLHPGQRSKLQNSPTTPTARLMTLPADSYRIDHWHV